MINISLKFNGRTEEAFKFYQSVLGGTFTQLTRYADTPHKEHLPAADQNKIMHLSYTTSEGVVMLGNDHLEGMGIPFKEGNNFTLAVQAPNKTEADRIFNGLSAGGNISMPIQEVFWGAYFGMFTDRFGIQWMVNYQK